MMEENQSEIREEEKEDGELEEGELEDDDEEEEQQMQEEEETKEDAASPKAENSPLKSEKGKNDEIKKVEVKEGHMDRDDVGVPDEKEAVSPKKEKRESKGESKRKHRDDDEEREKRKKKKKKRRHSSSDEEEDEGPSGPPKFSHRRVQHPPPFTGDLGFDAMLQEEMFRRGHSPPPGMMSYGPPGPFGPPHHPMFRGGRPMSDYDSFDSGSDSEMPMDHRRRRRHRRSRSRSRSPSRKNEAICMYYMQGSCQRGKSCPYSHDIQPQRKMELCKFYMMDCCAKKEKCLYMHKDFPCKYYHTGVKCKSAEKCKFSHEIMSDASRNILLKHIELAPKDILGDFPRLTKEAANLVVSITEAHRSGNPMDVENLQGIMDLRGRGFRYVDKAIKNLLKKQAKAKSLEDEEGGIEMKMKQERMLDSRKHGDFNDDRMPKMYGKHDHILSPSKHSEDLPRGNIDRSVENLVKAFRNNTYDKGMRNQPPPASPDSWRQRGGQDGGDWMGNKMDERGSFGQYKNMMNGDPSDNPSAAESMDGGDHGSGSGMHRSNSGKKLGGMMAGMPQKQRDFFQRIQQQHSLQEEDMMENNMDNATTGASNVNWYSSDEEGDGGPSSSKASWQKNSNRGNIMSPDRGPSGSWTPPPMDSDRFTPPGRKSDGSDGPPMGQPQQKNNPFSNINLDAIKINSTDLAIVLSAVKNQVASKKNNQEDSSKEARGLGGRDPREMLQDIRDGNFDMPKDNTGNSRYNREMSRDPRDVMASPRSDASYPSSSWGRNTWDQQSSMDSRDQHSGGFLSPKRQDSNLDMRQRMGDVDLRVLPRADSHREDSSAKSSSDTDMRMSSEHSIYDVDLRQLSLPKGISQSEDDISSLPFKVPIHTPAKEIDASVSSHPPMYYHLVKVTIPKPDFSHLKINKDDPKIMDDPRLRRMLRRNSTEDGAGKSPRGGPSRYDLESPFSPTGSSSSKSEPKLNEPDSRDPRMTSSRDPRGEPRVDPRSEARSEPRVDPRTNVRVDPRVGNRGDPRTDPRDPRSDQMNDMRNQDPRMSGMYGGGGNNIGMMEGGMQYQNMGAGLGPGSGPGPGPGPGQMVGPPMTRVDPRGRPGLLGPAPVPYSSNVPPQPPSSNANSGVPPYMMGQMGPNSGFYSDDHGDNIVGNGKFPPGGSNWGGPPSNDPRFHRDMSDRPHSYTPPPVS